MPFELFEHIILKHWKLQTSKVTQANFYFIYEKRINSILTSNILFTERGFLEKLADRKYKNRNVSNKTFYHLSTSTVLLFHMQFN